MSFLRKKLLVTRSDSVFKCAGSVPEDLTLVPSMHVWQLTVAYDPMCWGSAPILASTGPVLKIVLGDREMVGKWVENTGCSCRGLREFGSQNSSSQPSTTPVPRDLTFSSELCKYWAYKWYRQTCRQNTHTHKCKNSMYMFTERDIHTYTCTHRYTRQTHIHIHHILTETHTDTYANIQIRTDTHMPTCTYTDIHTCSHTHICTHRHNMK